MANDVGDVKGVMGSSTSLNNQAGAGGQKPMATSSSPADRECKPSRVAEGKVPMPK